VVREGGLRSGFGGFPTPDLLRSRRCCPVVHCSRSAFAGPSGFGTGWITGREQSIGTERKTFSELPDFWGACSRSFTRLMPQSSTRSNPQLSSTGNKKPWRMRFARTRPIAASTKATETS